MVQENVRFLAVETTTNGVWRKAEAEQFLPKIYPTGPLGKSDAVGIYTVRDRVCERLWKSKDFKVVG